MGFERGSTHFHSPKESSKTIPIIIEKKTNINKTLLIVELLFFISRRQPKITE